MDNNKAQELEAIRELKWREIMSRVDAYRFYIKLCLEANAFFFATTGVILGFYLNQPIAPPNYYLKFFLLLPILMGTVLGSICIYATRLQKEGSRIIEEIRGELARNHLETEEVPDVHLLDKLLLIFGFIFFLVATSLASVPLLKEAGSLQYFEWFGGIAVLIMVGGAVSTFLGIRKYDSNLKEAKAKKLEESSKLISPPAITEGQESQKKVPLSEVQTTAVINEQEPSNTGKKIER